MNNILVTGSNGQLGNEMRKLGINSINRYLFTDINELDITNLHAIRSFVKENNVSVIVNCAAYTAVDKAEDNKETANLINHLAVSHLATICKEFDATLIHISTDYVFQGDKSTPYNEKEVTNPIGIYGKTKLEGEKAISAAGCKSLIFRTSWLYSEFGNNFFKTMLKLTSEKDRLSVVFDQIGTPTYAGDLANLIFMIIEENKYSSNEGIYHYSNEGVCSWYDFAWEIGYLADNTKCIIEPCYSSQFPSKVKRPNFSVLDKSKVKSTFNVNIPYWKQSLSICLNNISNNKNE